jgi:hypothetical protein
VGAPELCAAAYGALAAALAQVAAACVAAGGGGPCWEYEQVAQLLLRLYVQPAGPARLLLLEGAPEGAGAGLLARALERLAQGGAGPGQAGPGRARAPRRALQALLLQRPACPRRPRDMARCRPDACTRERTSPPLPLPPPRHRRRRRARQAAAAAVRGAAGHLLRAGHEGAAPPGGPARAAARPGGRLRLRRQPGGAAAGRRQGPGQLQRAAAGGARRLGRRQGGRPLLPVLLHVGLPPASCLWAPWCSLPVVPAGDALPGPQGALPERGAAAGHGPLLRLPRSAEPGSGGATSRQLDAPHPPPPPALAAAVAAQLLAAPGPDPAAGGARLARRRWRRGLRHAAAARGLQPAPQRGQPGASAAGVWRQAGRSGAGWAAAGVPAAGVPLLPPPAASACCCCRPSPLPAQYPARAPRTPPAACGMPLAHCC